MGPLTAYVCRARYLQSLGAVSGAIAAVRGEHECLGISIADLGYLFRQVGEIAGRAIWYSWSSTCCIFFLRYYSTASPSVSGKPQSLFRWLALVVRWENLV